MTKLLFNIRGGIGVKFAQRQLHTPPIRNRPQFRDKRDWSIYHKPKDLAISITIEAAELLELFQWLSDKDIEQLKRSQKFISRVAEEIADILIYLLSLMDILGIDIVEQVKRKIKANETKYPPEKFGGTKFKEWLLSKYL